MALGDRRHRRRHVIGPFRDAARVDSAVEKAIIV